jgi:hypothetical protein
VSESANKAIQFIWDNAPKYAKARQDLAELESFKSSLKAIEMKKYLDLPVSAQEREAYASEEYQQLCKALGEATYNCELLKWKLLTAQMRFDAWRSEQANNRIMDKNVR